MNNSAGDVQVGIEALNAYCGQCCIPVRDLFQARGLNLDRLKNLMMEKRSIGLPIEDPVTNAVNAATPILDRLDPEERASIATLITATESGIDYSKSVASYVHEYLGLSNNCRLLEVKQACYGATAAVQMAVGYLASGISSGMKVLVIGTDVALVNERAEYAEPAIGAGAAAILIGNQPRVMTFDLGAFGNYSFETMDSARPRPDFEIADVDRSLFAYLDCLANAFSDYQHKVDGADFIATFDYLGMHTPFAGLVKSAHRKMMHDHASKSAREVDEDFVRRVRSSLVYPSEVGNLCSSSVYLALASIIEVEAIAQPSRVGLFSYGSGCSSEFFSGVIDGRSTQAMVEMNLGGQLRRRRQIDFQQYESLNDENLRCLVPAKNRKIDVGAYERFLIPADKRARMLVYTGVKDYRRMYDWI